MTNKEKYTQAFNAIYTSPTLNLEVVKMENIKKKRRLKPVLTAAAACVLIVSSASVAYAKDVAGIRRTIQLWLRGDQTDAVIQFDGKGHYNMNYTDDKGNEISQGGGGVAILDDGTEVAATEDELAEMLNSPEVEYRSDGSVWVYWFSNKLEITDKFEDDVCFLKLENGKDILYMTIKYKGGYATSTSEYIQPWQFN